MDANCDAELIEYARRGRLFTTSDRSSTMTMRDHLTILWPPQGGATAAEVNELIDAGKLELNLAGRSRNFSGFMFKRVVVAK